MRLSLGDAAVVTCDTEGDPLRPTALNERQAETGPASKDEFVRMHRDELTRPDPCSRSTGDDKAGKLAPGPCVPPPVGGRCWRGKNPNYGFADPLRLQAQPGFAAQIAASARNTRKGQDTGLKKTRSAKLTGTLAVPRRPGRHPGCGGSGCAGSGHAAGGQDAGGVRSIAPG